MNLELADCERVLLEDIARPEFTRRHVAQTYRLAIQSSERTRVDWAKVNAAIINRWSGSALIWIKEQAWSGKCFATTGASRD